MIQGNLNFAFYSEKTPVKQFATSGRNDCQSHVTKMGSSDICACGHELIKMPGPGSGLLGLKDD